MAGTRETYSIKLQIMSGRNIAMGPGKADLLEAIQKTGSIAAAGRAMGMSYKRAWDLVEIMNVCFCGPLVEKSKGGAGKGGATVTALGLTIIDQYRALQAKSDSAVEREMHSFFSLLKHDDKDK
tara:strand:+ start:159566 stop:159937 length:372 start_codon:yes stop_codon:yes gene_type:complete